MDKATSSFGMKSVVHTIFTLFEVSPFGFKFYSVYLEITLVELTLWSTVFLRSQHSPRWAKNFPPFMQPELSLPCSQGSTTSPYHDPDIPSPHIRFP